MEKGKYVISAYRIKECLEETNMQKKDLAYKIGVDPSTITHYTNGSMCPRTDTAQKMADVFHVSPLWLMNLSDEKKQSVLVEIAHQLNNDNSQRLLEYAKQLLKLQKYESMV